MSKKRVQEAVMILGLSLGLITFGAAPGFAQTDIALSALAAFSQTSTGNGTVQLPSIHGGGLLQLRHIRNPLVGYEVTYSYTGANLVYSAAASNAPFVPPPQPISVAAHQITGDWVFSLRVLNLKPFALAGAGVLIDQPGSDQPGTSTSTRAVYVYGAGLDIALIPHFGLRLQYRGNVNKAPDLSEVFTSTDRFIHTAEPMAGLYIRF